MTARVYKTFTLAEAARLAGIDVKSARSLQVVVAPSSPGRRYVFADVAALRVAAEYVLGGTSQTLLVREGGTVRPRAVNVSADGLRIGTISLVDTTPAPPIVVRLPLSEAKRAEVRSWRLEAWRLAEGDDLAQARELYERVLETDPEDLVAMVDLGNVYYRQGYRELARQRYLTVLRLDPKSDTAVQANYNLGVILAGEGRYAQAEAFYRASLRLDPNYPEAHFNLAATLEHLGRGAEAKLHWRRYLALAPGSPHAKEAREALRSP